MSIEADDFDYSSATVPVGALFVAGDPSLVFPSLRAAKRWIEANAVEKGVYSVAFGPKGEPYRIVTTGKRVTIESIGEPNKAEDLRKLLLKYLARTGQTFDPEDSTSELAQQVWRWESEFWRENDPFGDRFSKPMPAWCCLALVAIPAALLFVFVTKLREPLIGILGAALILWPVGVLAKRRASRTDFGT